MRNQRFTLRRQGGADWTMKPTLKTPVTNRLKLGKSERFSNFAFKFNWRRCMKVIKWAEYVFESEVAKLDSRNESAVENEMDENEERERVEAAEKAEAAAKVGRCRLAPKNPQGGTG